MKDGYVEVLSFNVHYAVWLLELMEITKLDE